MKRLEKIYQFVRQQTTEIRNNQGMTTQEISNALAIQRTNASKDLNELVREGKLIKIEGRPVRYRVADSVEIEDKKVYKDQEKGSSLLNKEVLDFSSQQSKDIFRDVIGATGSMKIQVEQAKAAILYPPKGLHALITGSTGTGKTFFAHTMFEYAKEHGLINNQNKKLVVFNCADYAHNPELLMSHLFGYKKGAFTGANETSDGLVHEADGGMLFLDEVHRLPPEGQEMIFYLMDHGLYSRLGETGKHNKASVRIVCATTENPTSALLDTFVRRIPIVIQLPNFNQRPAVEQINLLKNMLSLEANRIQRQIVLNEDAVKALIGSVTFGNIGQLKSNVQLVCARGFLNHMNNDEICITLDELTPSIKDGLLKLVSNRQELKDISRHLEPRMVIVPNRMYFSSQEDAYELPYNLYDIIGDKAALLKAEGMDQDHINHFIATDINIHLKSFYKDSKLTFDVENKLDEILDPRIIEVTKEIHRYAQETLNYPFQSNFFYAMGLHISSFLKQLQLGQHKRTININMKNMVADYPEEYQVAYHIKELIQHRFMIQVPEVEVYYLTILIVSLKEEKANGRIGIVVAAHGKSTATSMVQVVTGLLNVDNIRAVDMPLEMQPKRALEKMIHVVKEVDEGSGVIILVDMGSLATFNEEISYVTGVETKTVDMVTTPIILEAARKTTLLDTNLNELYNSLRKFRGYVGGKSVKMEESEQIVSNLGKIKAIIAICASGEGTAQQIKRVIEGYLEEYIDEEIIVLPISVVEMKEKMVELAKEYKIIATTGIVDPMIQAPFIPMEALFMEDTQDIFDKIITNHQLSLDVELTEETAKSICLEYMTESFTFINSQKVLEPLWRFNRHVTVNTIYQQNYSFAITMVNHLAGMLERVLKHDTLVVEAKDLERMHQEVNYKQIMQEVGELEKTFYLTVPLEEVYYIQQLLMK